MYSHRKRLQMVPILIIGVAFGLAAQEVPIGKATEDEAAILADMIKLMNTPVVSASKSLEKLSEAPATMIVVSRKDIERRGYTHFRELIEDLPGFDTALAYGDTFYKTYSRGYRNTIGDSMLFMVDGKVFNHLGSNVSDQMQVALPLSNIERVEIVYGPASAVYGANAFMGVINVITRQGYAHSASLKANLMGGSFSQKGVDLTWCQNEGDWGYSLTARRYEGDLDAQSVDRYEYTNPKYFRPIDGHSIFGNLPNYYDASATSPWQSSAVDLRLWVGNLEFGLQHTSLKSGYGLIYPWDRYIPASAHWETPQWSFFAKYAYEFNPDFSTTATVRYRVDGVASDSLDFETKWNSTGKYFETFPQYWAVTLSSLDFNQDFQWNATKPLTFNFGYVVSQEVQQRGYLFGDPNLSGYNTATYTPADLPPRPSPSLSDSMHSAILRRGAYFQGKLRLDEHQNLVAGIRDDWHIAFAEAVTLRGGYVGNWGGFNVKALYGQAYQEPTPRQLFAGWSGSGSNPALMPQRSWTAEISAGFTTSRWSLLADLYHIKNSNMILTIPGGAENTGTMNIQGLDLHGQLRFRGLLGQELHAWGYLSNTFKATGGPYNTHLNALNSNGIGDIAKSKFFLGATILFNDAMSLTLKGRSIGSRATVATNPVKKVDAYTTCELYFQYNNLLAKGLSVGLKITNLTDAKYVQPGLRDADAGATPALFDASGDYQGSTGYYNSLLPQAGRGFETVIRYQF